MSWSDHCSRSTRRSRDGGGGGGGGGDGGFSSSSSSGSTHGQYSTFAMGTNGTGRGAGAGAGALGGMLPSRPLSTVPEESARTASGSTLASLPHHDDNNNNNNNNNNNDTSTHHHPRTNRTLDDPPHGTATGGGVAEEQQQQQGEEQQPLLYKGPNIHTKRACRLWITIGFVTIIAILVGRVQYTKQTHGSNIGTGSSTPHSNPFVPRYDYIVVGGGPAGILTAVKLARKFPRLTVALLESGNARQAAVNRNLYDRDDRYHANSNDDQGTVCRNWESYYQSQQPTKFDIPLYWSGVASSASRRQVYGTADGSHIGPSSSSSSSSLSSQHLWPMGVGSPLLVGRGLGGSGLVNAMIYIRSLSSDWKKWNVTRWDYHHDVLPQYVALEKYTDEMASVPYFYQTESNNNNNNNNNSATSINTDATSPWRGTRGPITTVAAGYGADPIGKLFVQSALQAGIPLAPRGFNQPDNSNDNTQSGPSSRIGVGMYEYNIRYGTRESVAQALLGRRPVPTNLVIRTGHTVTRLLTEIETSTSNHNNSKNGIAAVRVRGVAYQTTDGRMGEFFLTQDRSSQVILAAGALLTPKLLGQSGIGPEGHVLKSPQVGQNCHDHPVVALEYNINACDNDETISSIYTIGDELEDYYISVAELQNVNASLTTEQIQVMGRLGTLGTAGFSTGAFLRSPWARSDGSPDIQLTVFPRVIEPHVTNERKRQNLQALRSSAMLVTVALLDADARYVVNASVPATMHPTDNTQWVKFEPPRLHLPAGRTQYLSTKDIKRLEWGVKQVRKILGTSPLADQVNTELMPGVGTDLHRWIRETVLPNAHWVGTTRMGTDPDSVVDENLLVRGTLNLRIVDAGVIPSAPNGNIHSTVTVIASRGADLIAMARNAVNN